MIKDILYPNQARSGIFAYKLCGNAGSLLVAAAPLYAAIQLICREEEPKN
jgi:hypothetical protein